MSIVTIVQLAALASIIIMTAGMLYEIRKLRAAYSEQQTELTRAVLIIREFQTIHPKMSSLLQRLDAAIKSDDEIRSDLQELIRRMDTHERHLAQGIEESGRKQQNEFALMRKGILSQDPNLRFSVLKDWLKKNSLAILRRAAQDWITADDLISIIPSVLEAEAEILNDRVLLVGTRGLAEKHAIAIGDHDRFSGFPQKFEIFPTTDRKLSQKQDVSLLGEGERTNQLAKRLPR